MEPTRLFAIIALIALPTVIYGGYSLLRFLQSGPGFGEFQRTYFRAGHAHAGVLIVLALIYYQYLGQTTVDVGLQWIACVALFVGILGQSGGFFIHMSQGEEGKASVGTTVTTIGAVILVVDLLFLAGALIWAYPD